MLIFVKCPDLLKMINNFIYIFLRISSNKQSHNTKNILLAFSRTFRFQISYITLPNKLRCTQTMHHRRRACCFPNSLSSNWCQSHTLRVPICPIDNNYNNNFESFLRITFPSGFKLTKSSLYVRDFINNLPILC